MTTPPDHPDDYPLTESECEDIGGHCYDRTPDVKLSDPPVYTRVCRHCGKAQRGRRRESVEWCDI